MRTEETQTSLVATTRQESSCSESRIATDTGAAALTTALAHLYTPAVELPQYLGRSTDYEWFLIPRPRLNSKTQQGAVLACADSLSGANQ
jgi:hypothetical protein